MELLDVLADLLTYRPLIFFYFLVSGYVVSWFIAFVVAKLLLDGERDIEGVAYMAWVVSLSLHLLLTVGFIWYVFDDYLTAGQWVPKGQWGALGFYPLPLVVDAVLILFLAKGLKDLSRVSPKS